MHAAAILAATLMVPATASAPHPGPDAEAFFEKRVRPVLVEHCLSCHGPQKQRGGLRVDSRAALLKGGDSGPAVVPGSPDKSLLVRVLGHDGDVKMPPKGKLPDAPIAALEAWVRQGATWPDAPAGPRPISSKADEQHWSFRPVREPLLPAIRDTGRVRTPVDRFILARLEAQGLALAPLADKRTLLRRVTFDLTGLPPTPEEIDAFLGDPSPDAFAAVVDRLLASPRYGERWGRHWLDLVRYADGFGGDTSGSLGDFTEIWRYRDWVTEAFNRDLPYNEFLKLQIAGDLLQPDDPTRVDADALVATGVLAIAQSTPGNVDPKSANAEFVDDQVDVVGRAFLGLTLACARCHDHKFDPVSTEDYYALAGIFFNTRHELHAPLLPKVAWERVQRQSEYLRARKRGLEAELGAWPTFGARLLGVLASSSVRGVPATALTLNPAVTAPLTVPSLERLAALRRELEELRKVPEPAVPQAVVMQDGGHAKEFATYNDAPVYIRGDPHKPGKVVPRGFPHVLSGGRPEPISQGSGRLQLANWLTRPDHPLTARVMVNRIWQHHFGAGIVRSSNNFGERGEPPTHPELLDYLAARFVRSGWSVKAMHRLLLLSSAYRQDSRAGPEAVQKDPENRLVGRMSRRRLEAEALRDSLLATSGRLDLSRGGPGLNDLSAPRRTHYLKSIRNDMEASAAASFGRLFDRPGPELICEQRAASTVAPQALFLLNDPFMAEQARALAGRLAREVPEGQPVGKIRRLYLLCLGRQPTLAEEDAGRRFLARVAQPADAFGRLSDLSFSHLAKLAGRLARPADPFGPWEQYCQLLFCTNEFLYVD